MTRKADGRKSFKFNFARFGDVDLKALLKIEPTEKQPCDDGESQRAVIADS